MLELLHAAVHPLNVVYTVLLGIVILYWLSVIVGALDLGSFDLDVDVDADVDVDVDTDVSGPSAGWFAAALHFFNVGRLPFMVIMTIVILSAWTMTVLSNHYWGEYAIGFALAMTAPIVLLSFIIAKIISTPLIPLFNAMNQEVKPVEYVGQECRVKLPAKGNHFGQAEVDHDGDILLVKFKAAQPTMAFHRGQAGVIVGRSEDKKYWLIEPLEP